MLIRNFYVVLLCLVLTGIVSCKKSPAVNNNTGNTQVNTTGKDVPAGYGDGATFLTGGTSAIFNLYAPGKTSVSIIGDFNNWTPTALTNSTDGTRWWVQINNLNAASEYTYQYVIDGSIKVADPYSHKILDPTYDPAIPASVYPNLKA